MGAWNVTITGNDAAQDLKKEYQAAFFFNDAAEAVAKLDAYVREEYAEDEWCDYVYSLADYMWKHGILTDTIRSRAVELIDSGAGLDIWAESGQKILEKRKKVLADFREKLLSPQPPKKKITVNLYLNPVFEPGDLVAIQLQTAAKHYISDSPFSEAFFRECHGKYLVLRKAADHVSYTSRVEPRVRDIWAVFQLYDRIFDHVPSPEELHGIPWADTAKNQPRFRYMNYCQERNGTFICESSMFHFRKRKYVPLGRDNQNLPAEYHRDVHFFLGSDHVRTNCDTEILSVLMDAENK